MKCYFLFHDWEAVRSLQAHQIEAEMDGEVFRPQQLGLPNYRHWICLKCGEEVDEIERYKKRREEVKSRGIKAAEMIRRKLNSKEIAETTDYLR